MLERSKDGGDEKETSPAPERQVVAHERMKLVEFVPSEATLLTTMPKQRPWFGNRVTCKAIRGSDS